MPAAPVAILFANIKGNIGDFAILHAVLRASAACFPGHPLHVYTHGFHGTDEPRFAAFRDSIDLPFELAGKTYVGQAPLKPVFHVVRALGKWPNSQKHLITKLSEQSRGDAKKFADYEASVGVGGAHWSGVRTGVSMFGTLEAIRQHNDRIWLFPFSINPKMIALNDAVDLQNWFSHIRAPLVVRDSISKSFMDRIGVPAVLGADCVFGLAGEARNIPAATDKPQPSIILAVTGNRRLMTRDLQAAIDNLGSFKAHTTLMTTCAIEDSAHVKAIADKNGLRYSAPLTWQAAVAEMKASSLVITNRLHGLIFSTLAGTPVLPLANRSKSEAFVADAKLPLSVAALGNLSDTLISDALARSDHITSCLAQYLERTSQLTRSPLPGSSAA